MGRENAWKKKGNVGKSNPRILLHYFYSMCFDVFFAIRFNEMINKLYLK